MINVTAYINVSDLNLTLLINGEESVEGVGKVERILNTSEMGIGVFNLTAFYTGYNFNYSSSSSSKTLIIQAYYSNSSMEFVENETTCLELPQMNVTLRVRTNQTLLGSINVSLRRDSEIPLTRNISRFLWVNVSENVESNLSSVSIEVGYSDSDIPSLVDESSLRFYRWNGSSWEEEESGVDTNNNIVWCNLTHLSYFGIGGLLEDGAPCSSDEECSSGFCCHSVCRESCPFCGDGYCDEGESCSSCPQDCGSCPTTTTIRASGGGYVPPKTTTTATNSTTTSTSTTTTTFTTTTSITVIPKLPEEKFPEKKVVVAQERRWKLTPLLLLFISLLFLVVLLGKILKI